jgi:hypothetical protein
MFDSGYEVGTAASPTPVKKRPSTIVDALRAVANLSHRVVPSTGLTGRGRPRRDR